MTIELYFIAVIAVLSALVVPWYVRRLKRDAELYAIWQQRFFDKFDLVANAEAATPEMLNTALLFGKTMRNRKVVWMMVKAILTGEARKPSGPRSLDMSNVPAKLVMDYSLMVVAWFHALSHTAVIRGWMMRNLMFPVFRDLNDMNGDSGKVPPIQEAELRPYREVATASLPKRHLAAAA